jgi:hypothetical protein
MTEKIVVFFTYFVHDYDEHQPVKIVIYDVRLPVEEGEVVRRYPDTGPAQVNTLEPVVHVHAVLNKIKCLKVFFKFSNFQILNINSIENIG